MPLTLNLLPGNTLAGPARRRRLRQARPGRGPVLGALGGPLGPLCLPSGKGLPPAPCTHPASRGALLASHEIPRALGASISVPLEWDDPAALRDARKSCKAPGRWEVVDKCPPLPGEDGVLCQSTSRPSPKCFLPANPQLPAGSIRPRPRGHASRRQGAWRKDHDPKRVPGGRLQAPKGPATCAQTLNVWCPKATQDLKVTPTQ